MLYTLHKYILRELLRVFILATVALTLILSLGSILQPVQQYGAGPKQVISLMVYFLPITLTFVLPMAALFAGALVYGRFASDNEIDACRASGLSIITLVRPGFYLAVVVAIANLFLSFQVMPRFVHLAEKSLKADAKQLVFRNIQKNGYYKIPSDSSEQYFLYADEPDFTSDTLWGIIVTKLKNNQIEQITTSQSAVVQFTSDQNINKVHIYAKDTYQMDPQGVMSLGSSPFTAQFGSLLGDDIAFKRIEEMSRIHRDITSFEPVGQLAQETFNELLAELLAREIQDTIASQSGSTGTDASEENFYYMPGEPNSVSFTASQCIVKDGRINLSGGITMVEYDSVNQTVHTFTCEQAYLVIETDASVINLSLDIRNAREQATNQLKMRHIIQNLYLPEKIQKIAARFIKDNGSLNAEWLTSDISAIAGIKPGKDLVNLQNKLSNKILRTNLEIKAEINSRLVFAVGCIAMILIGIGLGVVRRDGHLLSAFGASCIPAAMLIVCIMSGKQLTKNLDAQAFSGVALMWGGLALLFLMVIVIYYRLLKN